MTQQPDNRLRKARLGRGQNICPESDADDLRDLQGGPAREMNHCVNVYRAGFSCCISSRTSRSASSQSWTSCPTSPPLRSKSSYAFRATRALNSGLLPRTPLPLDSPLERSGLDFPLSPEDCQSTALDESCMVDRCLAIVTPLPHYIVGAIVALPYLWYSPPLELLAAPPASERADVYSFMLTSGAGLTTIGDSCRL
jgi:hypothetical protein